MIDQTRFFITTRENIDENISNGQINANDLIICSDTHELIYVDENNNYFAITTTGEGMHELVQQLEERLAEIQEAAENSIVTGVKGSNERDYRTGNVNLGTDDFGLGNVTNHAQVRGLISGTTEDHLVSWGNNGYIVKDSGVTAVNGDLSANSITINSSTYNSSKSFNIAVNDLGELYTISNDQNHTVNQITAPTQVSQLQNDSQFMTQSEVNTALNQLMLRLSPIVVTATVENDTVSLDKTNEEIITALREKREVYIVSKRMSRYSNDTVNTLYHYILKSIILDSNDPSIITGGQFETWNGATINEEKYIIHSVITVVFGSTVAWADTFLKIQNN